MFLRQNLTLSTSRQITMVSVFVFVFVFVLYLYLQLSDKHVSQTKFDFEYFPQITMVSVQKRLKCTKLDKHVGVHIRMNGKCTKSGHIQSVQNRITGLIKFQIADPCIFCELNADGPSFPASLPALVGPAR